MPSKTVKREYIWMGCDLEDTTRRSEGIKRKR